MSDSKIISGSAMAVLLGFGSVGSSIFIPEMGLGSRIILFLVGGLMIWLGLYFSRG